MSVQHLFHLGNLIVVVRLFLVLLTLLRLADISEMA